MQNRRWAQQALGAIVGGFVLLALLYNWASPLFENADEPLHYPLIHHLAEENFALPVQNPAQVQLWRQQGSQPPLYHLLAAALIRPLDRSDFAQRYQPNPHARTGIISESNRNAVLHPLDRGAEFRGGTAWSLRLLRLFSTLLAAGTVALSYALFRLSFPRLPKGAGLLAAALVAFNPMHIFVAASVNNDNLSNLLITALLVLLAWLYRREQRPAPWHLLLLGLLLGLGLLSKLSMGPFLLLVGVYWLLLARRFGAWRWMLGWGLLAALLMLLVSGWWYWRNYDLYGDPTGLNRFVEVVGARPPGTDLSTLWGERSSFIRSFWGVFGVFAVGMPDAIYAVFNGLGLLGLLGAGLFFARQKRLEAPQSLLLLWMLLSFLSLLRWSLMTPASQGRLWFLALPALASFGALGFYEVARRIGQPALAALPALFGLGVAVAAPFLWIRPAYAPPAFFPQDAAQRPLALFHDPAAPHQRLALIDARFPAEFHTEAASDLHLELCSLSSLDRNWSVFVHLVDAAGLIVAQADFTPGYGAIPSSELAAGQCWRERYPLMAAAGALPEDSELQLRLGFYHVPSQTRMISAEGESSAPLGTTLLRVGEGLRAYRFGAHLALRDYALSGRLLAAGDVLDIRLDWEVLAPLDADYTLFVQVIDPATASKAASLDLALPSGQWASGETVSIKQSLPLAPDAAPGTYVLLVGWYQQGAGGNLERLPLLLEGRPAGQDALRLGTLRVAAD